MFDNARIAKHNAMAWHIAIHVTIGRNQHVIINGNLTNNRCVNSYPHAVTNGGHTFTTASVFLPDGDPFMDITVLADDGVRIDSDAINMS